jgi:uncharacterized protein
VRSAGIRSGASNRKRVSSDVRKKRLVEWSAVSALVLALLVTVAGLLWAAAYVRMQSQVLADALERDDHAAVKLAVQRGADVNSTSRDGRSALMVAAEAGDSEFVRYLLERKADPNAWTLMNETPLLAGVKCGSLPIVRMLLARGAQPDSPRAGPHSMSPLQVAVFAGHTQIVLELLSRGADPNAVGGRGTLLRMAVDGRHRHIISLLEGARARRRDP